MSAIRIIKKYPNRRLYDTEISSYITIEDVRQLIVDGESFEVRDAKTGEDLTRQVLLRARGLGWNDVRAELMRRAKA